MHVTTRRDGAEDQEEEADDEEDEGVEEGAFTKRSGPCLGCESDVNVDSAEIKEMASFALQALENAANTDKVQSVVRVTKATSQVMERLTVFSLKRFFNFRMNHFMF